MSHLSQFKHSQGSLLRRDYSVVGLVGLVGWCGLLFVTASGPADAETSFSAEGYVESRVLGLDTNEVVFLFRIGFEIDVDGCRWAVKSRTLPDDGHSMEMSFDGTNTYSTILGAAGGSTNSVIPGIAAQVKRENVPFISALRADCVWLALASNCYLDHESPGRFSPAWISMNRTKSSLLGERFGVSVRRYEAEPRLPESLECMADGFTYGSTAGGGRKSLPPPFDQGFVCLKYEVLETTNVTGLVLPLKAIVRYFKPLNGGATREAVRENMKVAINVESVRMPTPRTVWSPVLASQARIEDFRLITAARPDEIKIYDAPGPNWPAVESIIVSRAPIKPLSQGTDHDAGRAKWVRWFVIGGMLLLSVLFGRTLFRSRPPSR
jgi:hypothetical protein